MARFNWSLFLQTASAVLGMGLVLLGFTELGIVVWEGEGRVRQALLAIGVGLILAGVPLSLGVRRAIREKRRGET